MKNRTYFKIISFILIQTFLVLDICWAANGQAIVHTVGDSTLAPSLTISNIDLQLTFDIVDEDEALNIDFNQDLSPDEDNNIGVKAVPQKLEEAHEMSTFSTSNSSNMSPLVANNVIGGNPQSIENISLPPPDDILVQGALGNVDGLYLLANNSQVDDSHDITNGDIMKQFGLSVADINFLNKILLFIPEKTEFFEGIELTSPHPLNKDELNRAAQGPFRVLSNTRAQNSVDLAASAIAIGLPLEIIIGKMISIFSFDREVLNEKSKEIVNILHAIVSTINSNRDFKLADVYTLATKLVSDFRQIGIEAVDEGHNRRRTLGVRPHLIPTLREEYIKNPRRMRIYLYEMSPWHEDGHVLPLAVAPFQLKWTSFGTKEVALSIFKKLVCGDWPGELQNLGFLKIIERSQARSAVDAIVISQWLYGYHPLKKEFRNAYWKEALANYYAYLKKIKKENGNDALAIEMLAIGTHYGIQLNPPDGKYLEADLVNTLNSFFPFLNPDQAKIWTQKVLEMQAEDGVLSEQASNLLEKLKNSKLKGDGSTTTLYSHPALFTIALAVNQKISTNVIDGNDWMLALGVAAAIGLTAWAWKKMPFFKSVENRTVQLVNKTIRTKDPSALMSYYQSAKITDKIKIINIASQQLSKKSGKVNLELFENLFLKGFNVQASSVAQNIQDKISSLFKQRIASWLNAREMSAILDQTALETGINFHQGNSLTKEMQTILNKVALETGVKVQQVNFVAIEAKLTDIINSLAKAKNLNADSFIGEIEKDRDLDLSIDRILIKEFARKVRGAGSSEKALKIIVSEYNEKYNLGVNVANVVSYSAGSFQDLSMGELNQTVSLQANADFMASFVQAQKNAQVRVLFDNILKQIIITQETRNMALLKIINKALKQIIPPEINRGESMLADIAILVGRLAIEGNLHKQDVFVKQAESMSAVSRIMNAEQMRALYSAIITLLETGYKYPDKTKIELVAAEFDKAGLGNKVGSLTSGLAAAVLASANGENVALLNTPLFGIGEKIKASALVETIVTHNLFRRFNPAEQEKIKGIILNIDNTLINNLALGLVFENVNNIVAKELNNLDLKDINKQRAQLGLVTTLGRGALLGELQAARAAEFENAVEAKVDELRYASAVALRNFSLVDAGTGNMVARLRAYLNEQGPNISMALKRTLEETVKNLSVQDKAAKVTAMLNRLAPIQDSTPAAAESSVLERVKKKIPMAAPEMVIHKPLFQIRFMVESAI
ncbi:MAG: hypothetical protein V1747_02260 [Candidatus Omnitrophota bacterium]